MGTTSEKLTYLNNTKQLLKENINNLGGNLTTEPFRQYASVLEDIYERIPKVSGIGTSLSLSPTMAGKIKLNEIQGDTLQDGTPTPDTPVEIQSVTGLQNIGITGKNLFDKDKITSAATIDGTKITMLRSSGWATNKILFPKKLTAGTTITASRSDYNVTNNAGIAIQLFNGDTSVRYMDLVDETYTLTLPSDVDSWRLTITYNSSSDTTGYVKDVQLEVGSATSYEPYKGNNYEVNLGNIELNKIGDYQDRIYKDNGKWYVEKQIGKVNLEDYEYNKYNVSTGYSRNTTTQIPNIKYVSVNTELGKGLCEKYQIHTGTGMSESGAENHFAIDVSMFQVSIPNNDTPSGLFYYALAIPTYEVITNPELIEDLETLYTAKSQEGTTNISITSEDLEMILNVSALKGDVE